MATILEFKLPPQKKASSLGFDAAISSSVNDVMLMIHHALHGADKDCRPKNLSLAAALLGELSEHIGYSDENTNIVLSNKSSAAIVDRYPEIHIPSKYQSSH